MNGNSKESETSELASRLRLSMVRLSRQLRRHDPSELTIAQLSSLTTVVRCGPIGIGKLAEIEGLPSPAATRLADKLEEAGLIIRRTNPTDRRGVYVVASEAGADLFARREQSGNAWLAEHLARLSKVDRLALKRVVAVLEVLATERPDSEPVATGGRRTEVVK
jgi:DNA-binding MarR family transcriptional regulator